MISDSLEEDEDDVIMIDMGNQGEHVNIPTYMVSKSEGDLLTKAFRDG